MNSESPRPSALVLDADLFDSAAVNTLVGILACLVCNCIYVMTAPIYHFLAHYCSNCGIRLAVVPWHADPIPQLDRNILVYAEPTTTGENGRKVAPSPFGPPSPVNEAMLRNFAERFSAWAPSLILEIQLEGDFSFPTTVFDAAGSRILYEISWPGMPAGKDRCPSPIEYESIEPMAAEPKAANANMKSWNPLISTPHIHVSALEVSTSTEGISNPEIHREIATAQVFPNARDYVLRTPHQDPNGTIRYDSRRSGIRGKHSPKADYMIWNSCSGPLTWTLREIRDKDSLKSSRHPVLLDAYDRLVGMMSVSPKKDMALQLKLYGSLCKSLSQRFWLALRRCAMYFGTFQNLDIRAIVSGFFWTLD
jgi:hypothetical protein